MSIKIEKAIIHVLDASAGFPVLSSNIINTENEIGEYISNLIQKAYFCDDVKECMFTNTSTIWEQCQNATSDIVSLSKIIAKNIFNIMRRNMEIPSADLIIGTAIINESRFLFMLKLNYKCAYTHYVQGKSDNLEVDIIRYKTLFPSQTTRISEGFFINMQVPTVKVIEKKFNIDGIKDYYLSTLVLACTENITARQKATNVIKTAEKVAKLYYSNMDEMDVHISTAMYNEMQQESPLLIENLGEKFFINNPAAQEEFFERLAAVNVNKNDVLALSEKFRRKFEKHSIKTPSGVEIKIPSQIFTDVNEVEFINNPDGSISLLIKNVML